MALYKSAYPVAALIGAILGTVAVLAPTVEAAPAPTSVAAAGIVLRSVHVELPTSERMLPGGAEAEAVTVNCTACHSLGMITNQPGLTAATWKEEVNKMRNAFKAPIAEADVPGIVAYLAKYKGPT